MPNTIFSLRKCQAPFNARAQTQPPPLPPNSTKPSCACLADKELARQRTKARVLRVCVPPRESIHGLCVFDHQQEHNLSKSNLSLKISASYPSYDESSHYNSRRSDHLKALLRAKDQLPFSLSTFPTPHVNKSLDA